MAAAFDNVLVACERDVAVAVSQGSDYYVPAQAHNHVYIHLTDPKEITPKPGRR